MGKPVHPQLVKSGLWRELPAWKHHVDKTQGKSGLQIRHLKKYSLLS